MTALNPTPIRRYEASGQRGPGTLCGGIMGVRSALAEDGEGERRPDVRRADSPSRRRWLRGICIHVMSGGSPDGVDGEARNERPVTVVFWRIKLAG